MNTKNRAARAKIKAKRNRMERWRHGEQKNLKRAKPRSGPMVAARGPGSINAEAELQRLVRTGCETDAAAFYDAFHDVFYKEGKPKLRWGHEWYAQHKREKLAVHGVAA